MDAIYDVFWDQLQLTSFMESMPYLGIEGTVEALWNGDIRFFPLYYWIILVFSIYGMIQSFLQLYQHVSIQNGKTDMYSYLQGCSFLSCQVLKVLACSHMFIVAKSWILLVSAVLMVSPAKMYVWLFIHGLLLIVQHLAIAVQNIRMGHMWFWPKSARTVISLLFNLVKLGIVYQTMCAFDVALIEERPEELRLLSKILKAL
ncbi:uncharacterized protein LOC117579725 [Drosophila guanche]|uniref:uncharacterized protein LOC117579725 n=1 Tax=Drosophila guanche TaxID=7266 RepID=UPI001470E657|nr:uncharacterized protein LOC117579725 [Drosophila guanche]